MAGREPRNPLREGMSDDRAPDAGALVIFGASGDLARRKLLPALYNLYLERWLPGAFAIVGVARRPMGDAEFASTMHAAVAEHSRRSLDATLWEELASRMSYIATDFEDPQGYARLRMHLEQLDRERGTGGNRLYYLATPPSAFPAIVLRLGEAGLHRAGPGGRWVRIVVEKPVGRDLASARELNETINRYFPERSVFRIDHYLGKETVQNLMVFRFANAIFEPLWNRQYVDHVQITVAESLGVEGRGRYYEEAGATRDMVQNHMFQLLCLTAMEPPVSLAADAIRDEKVKVLHALRPPEAARVAEDSVRAQYVAGVVGGRRVPGYREEPAVAADSRTETYVALRVFLDNWRWAGTPFYLRSGKRMPKRVSEVALQFRDVPHRLFGTGGRRPVPNTLAVRIQPDEGITLRFDAKVPGPQPRIQPVTMEFRYGTSFGQEPPEAYERLLLDAWLGDATLFIRRDEVEASWAFVDQLFAAWEALGPEAPLAEYPAGSWGPSEADVMLARDGRQWRRP